MARTADKPGTYRVIDRRGGRVLLSGVNREGDRVKLHLASRVDAERMAKDIFGPTPGIGPIPDEHPKPPATSVEPPTLDDWGFPVRVSPETAARINASFAPTGAATPVVAKPPTEDEEDKRIKRAKNAKSLMELAGVGWATGTVWAGRKICEKRGLEAVNPNPRQVNDLRDVTRETLSEWFGDREISPWQMMFLLSIGIPLSMWIQSPKLESAEKKLKSVP